MIAPEFRTTEKLNFMTALQTYVSEEFGEPSWTLIDSQMA